MEEQFGIIILILNLSCSFNASVCLFTNNVYSMSFIHVLFPSPDPCLKRRGENQSEAKKSNQIKKIFLQKKS